MKVFIIDDEPPAVNAIKALLNRHESEYPIQLLGTSNDSVAAIEEVNRLKPEILFLDVEMPGNNGFEFLAKISFHDLIVIFVTAYRDYAVEAFKENALDYIVKPISPKAFKSCLERIDEKLKTKAFNAHNINLVLEKMNSKSLAVRTNNGYEVIDYDTIVWVKSEGAYSEFYLQDGKNFVQTKNLKQCLKILPAHLFKRISRSAVINIEKVASFSFSDGGSILLTNGQELLIGKTYRTELFSFLREKYSL
jgi:two-component system LytT family response regulator